METLGSLCDKLTIVKLKQFHSTDLGKLKNLEEQEILLKEEIDLFFQGAFSGGLSTDRLVFLSNKVYKKEGIVIEIKNESIGFTFARLADTNCKLWHEQEKIYEFEKVALEDKDQVVKNIAILNLERNQCMDAIDLAFQKMVREFQNRT